MPIQGSIEEAGLPDVLQLLALGRKSGCLSLGDGTLEGHIYLDVGRVTYATVANRLDRLGEMLVKSGRLTREQLDAAVEEQRRSSKRQLGRILVDSGRIDRAELERFVRMQVEEAVYFLFTWKQGTFTFTSDRLPPHQPLLVSLDAEGLLLEGARRVDEWGLIEKKIPSFDLVYRRTRENLGATADGLTDVQKRLLPLVDGECNVTGLVDDTGLSEFEVGKALYGLLTAGLIQLVERRSHIRHLEYRELLAYSVKEAEFADPQRRKDAARHIVDCVTCSERLRTIHVRRTTRTPVIADLPPEPAPAAKPPATPVVRPAAPAARPVAPAARAEPRRTPKSAPATIAMLTAPAPTAASAPVALSARAAPAPSPPPATASQGMVERRHRDRRAGHDRRQRDRRAGVDRRVVDGIPFGAAQRIMRREDDRRVAGRDRRGSFATRPASAAASLAPASPRRRTEPRKLASVDPEELQRLVAAAPAAEAQADLAASREDESTPTAEEFTAELEAQADGEIRAEDMARPDPVPPEAETRPELAAAPGAEAPSPTASAGPDPAKGELAWLVTPHESLEMLRASAMQMRAAAAAAPGATPTPDRRARPPAAPVPAAAGPRPPVGPPRSGTLRFAPPRIEDQRNGGGGAPTTPQSRPPSFPLRALGSVAAIAAMGFVGYLAGHGRGARPDRPADTSSVAAAQPAGAGARSARDPRTAGQRGRPRPTPLLSAPRAAAPSARTEPGTAVRAPALATQPQRAQPGPAISNAAVIPTAPPQAPPAPAATTGTVRGVVRDAGGRPVPGARVSVRGTSLSAQADGSGAFEIQDVPPGAATLQASADGFVAASAQVQVEAGGTAAATLALARPAAATAPDSELAAGGWIRVSRADATSSLGGTLGIVPGLSVESVAQSAAGSRMRIRVAQLTPTGERIVLTETRAGADVRGGSGPAVVTSVRVMPASEAYPWSTGTVSFGNILITAKTHLAADQLRSYLGRISEAPGGE